MAKKNPTKKKTVKKKTKAKTVRKSVVGKKRDAVTKKKIEDFGSEVVESSLSQREPSFEIPTRSVTNMKYNKKKRILEMGSNTQKRSLFNLGQSKKFMQSLLLAKGCRDLIDAQKTLSLDQHLLIIFLGYYPISTQEFNSKNLKTLISTIE